MILISLSLWSILIDFSHQIISGQAIGSRFPLIGRRCPRSACFHRKLRPLLRKRLQPCHPVSVRSSSCATSRDGRRQKPVTSSEYQKAISGCFSTAHARKCVAYLRTISRKSRLHMILRDLFEVATDKKVSVIIFPVPYRSLTHLLFIYQHKQINQITLQQLCNEKTVKPVFQ